MNMNNKYNSDTYQKFQARMSQQQPIISQNQIIFSNSPNGSSSGSGSQHQHHQFQQQNEVKVIEETTPGGENQSSSYSGASSSIVNNGPNVNASTIPNSLGVSNQSQQPESSSSSSLVSLSPISNASASVTQANMKGCRKTGGDINGPNQIVSMMNNNLKLEGIFD